MSTLASDTFTRADSGSIGSDWTEVSGTWDIASNKLKLTTFSSTGANAHTDDEATWDTALNASPAADYDVECVVNAGTTGGLGVLGRRQDLNNTYWLRINTVSQYLRMYKTVSGTVTQLGSTYSGGQSSGVDYTIKLSMVGSSLTGYQAGTSRITATDSAITATGKPGVFGDSSNKLFDSFAVYGTLASSSAIKTALGLAKASVKTVDGLAIASVKTMDGLA